jgi:hypothetical protein
VRSINQFELTDSAPNRAQKKNSYAYWARSFQTGLEFNDGQPKPSFGAFRLPIWVPNPRHGPRVYIWGQIRPAIHASQYAVVEYERRGARSFSQIGEVRASSPEGFIVARVRLPAAGLVRIAWLESGAGTVDYSRVVSVS